MRTELQIQLEAAMVPKAWRNLLRAGSRKCVVSGLLYVLGVFLMVIRTGQADTITGPIRLHPDNRHYFLYQGRPTVLITSAEHYGAVINKDFDYAAYLGTLKAYGLNYTRIYPGVLYEPQGKFMKGNTLGPRPGGLIVPWARGVVPASNLCGNKFDLDQWDSEYFARLKDFIAKAREGGVVVEICFFNSQYSDTWPLSPLYWENNIQGVGKCEYTDAQTLKQPDLVKRMEDYVRKIAEEVNGFDNVVLEICDEPSLFTPVEQAGPWVRHLVHFLFETEAKLPKQHLIAQQVEGPLGGPIDLSTDNDVSVIVTQYLWEAGDQTGGIKGLEYLYGNNKPVEENETDYYPIWYQGDKIGDSRVEAWEFVVGGGASFNQLNGLYTAENPTGKTAENERILTALKALREFIYSFDFIRMHPDKGFIASGVPSGGYCRGISEPGRQYALYLHHSTGGKGGAYKVTPGDYVEKLVLDLPDGNYRVDWVDPATGSILGSETVAHSGESRTFATPKHRIDIALRIKRI